MECVPDTWKTLGPVEASIFRERLCLLWVKLRVRRETGKA